MRFFLKVFDGKITAMKEMEIWFKENAGQGFALLAVHWDKGAVLKGRYTLTKYFGNGR